LDERQPTSVLQGKGNPARKHDYLYWEFHEEGGSQAVRWGKWKGVRLSPGNTPKSLNK
jgi:hypothetical protein